MARNEQLIRQHKVLEILERYRYGRQLKELRDEVVDELGLTSLSARTLRRDLEALQAAGFDLAVHDEQRGKVWRLGNRNRAAHKVSVSSTELTALSLGRDLLLPLAGTPFWQGIQSFWTKIHDELPGSVWDHYAKYREVLYVLGIPAKSYEKHQGILKTINRAILQHRVVSATYQAIGKPASVRLLEPYAVVFFQNSLYIIAAAHDPDETAEHAFRNLKLDRFVKAEALDEYFKPDPGFSLEQHLGQGIGIFAGRKPKKFKIRISSYAKPWVLEDPWHPDQQVEEKKDGSIVLTLEASHELEVIPKVLSLGTEAELLSPAAARKNLAKTLRQMADQYD